MKKSEWVNFHGFNETEMDIIDWLLSNGCYKITAVFNYTHKECFKKNTLENKNKIIFLDGR